MKKKFKILLLACIIGGIMAYITYNKFSYLIKKDEPVYIYQVGIYKNYQNALSKALSVDGAIIVNNDYGYQVVAGVAKSQNSKDKMEQLLQNEEVDYYPKEVVLPKEAYETLEEYELVINETSSWDTLKVLNQKLLQALEERLS